MRPPSGSDSNTWLDVYWSTPIAMAPRDCTPAKPLSRAALVWSSPRAQASAGASQASLGW